MNITKQTVRDLRSAIQGAINNTDITERYGVKVEVGNATFDSAIVRFRLSASLLDIGDGRPAAAAEWDLYRSRYGLDNIEFGHTFSRRSVRYKVCGVKPRSRKYPVLAADPNGKVYKFQARTLLEAA